MSSQFLFILPDITNHKFVLDLYSLYSNTTSSALILNEEKMDEIQCNSTCIAQGVNCTSSLLEELSLNDETSQLFNATLHC